MRARNSAIINVTGKTNIGPKYKMISPNIDGGTPRLASPNISAPIK